MIPASNYHCHGCSLRRSGFHPRALTGKPIAWNKPARRARLSFTRPSRSVLSIELSKAFKEKYPFLNVRHIRLGPAQQLARIMQEQRAGHFLADVVYNNLLHLIYLKENGSPREIRVTGKQIPDERSDRFRWVLGRRRYRCLGDWLQHQDDFPQRTFRQPMTDFWTAGSRGRWPSTATTRTRSSGWRVLRGRGTGDRVHEKTGPTEPSAGARVYPHGRICWRRENIP